MSRNSGNLNILELGGPVQVSIVIALLQLVITDVLSMLDKPHQDGSADCTEDVEELKAERNIRKKEKVARRWRKLHEL
jgi:hypothetical protein